MSAVVALGREAPTVVAAVCVVIALVGQYAVEMGGFGLLLAGALRVCHELARGGRCVRRLAWRGLNAARGAVFLGLVAFLALQLLPSPVPAGASMVEGSASSSSPTPCAVGVMSWALGSGHTLGVEPRVQHAA